MPAGYAKRRNSMAMFEKEGYCPNNAFTSNMRAKKMLGARTAYMVYYENDVEYGTKRPNIVECLDCDDENLSVQICSHLQSIIPVCIYAERGRKIRIHDIVNPHQCASDLIQMGELNKWEWSFAVDGRANVDYPVLTKGSRRIFFNNDWFVMIDDHSGEESDPVDIYLFHRRSI